MPEQTDAGVAASDNGTAATEETQREPNGRWQKGQSGNPAGSPPKVKSLTAALEGIIEKDELARRMVDIAMGELTTNVAIQLEAAKYIYARIEGNPVQALRHQTEGQVTPLIFLHPGRETAAPPPETASDSPDSTSRRTPEP